MFVAQNKFQVNEGFEERFEQHSGETGIGTVPGFLFTARLKGDERGVYINLSVWEDRAAFDAWVVSDAFKAAHATAPAAGALVGHPEGTFTEVLWAEGSIIPTTA
jgi:heme-degrading monooxygenase HmoA